MTKTTFITSFLILIVLISCQSETEKYISSIENYTPVDKELYDEILEMDEKFFNAYNNCDLETQASIYSDRIEFFHDKGGLMTSKEQIIEGTKNNICGKVTRELIEGSVEVYPINDYGAVQIGYHKFFNNQEPDAESIPSKFIAIWQNDNGTWKMTKVISLHN
jgi:hypothetical protein